MTDVPDTGTVEAVTVTVTDVPDTGTVDEVTVTDVPDTGTLKSDSDRRT